MLRVLPKFCMECGEEIPFKKGYEDGLVQMECRVKGFASFKMETFFSWCSHKCFSDWISKHLKEPTGEC